MEGEVCKTCGGNCMFCKVTQVVGPLIIIALTWTLGMFFNMLYSKIAITVVAVIIAGMMFCPCRKVGAIGMSGGSGMKAAPAAKPAAKMTSAKATA